MREVRVTTPDGQGAPVAELALARGIAEASVYPVYVHGPQQRKEVVSVQVSTPEAKHFIDALMAAPFYDPRQYSVASDELIALVAAEDPDTITKAMVQPSVDVYEEMWQFSHISPGYLSRAIGASLVLAYGLLQDNLILMASALLFAPFLAHILPIGFATLCRDWRLVRRAALMFVLSVVIAVAAGALVAALVGGPLQYNQWSPPLASFLVSLIIGIAAAVNSADDRGRRQLIAFGAAAQLAIIPVWLGIVLVLGLPEAATLLQRLGTFALNAVGILVASIGVYAALHIHGQSVQDYFKAGAGEGKAAV